MDEDYNDPEDGPDLPFKPSEGAPATVRTLNKRKQAEAHRRLYAALDGSGDPIKLKQIIGAKTVAEVYRTLDKLTIRREFHDALSKAGITFEFLIEGIKREAIGGDKSMDRLKAYEMLLKTLGLDKYDDMSSAPPSSWEERLLKAIENNEEVLDDDVEEKAPPVTDDYKVISPQIPASVLSKKKETAEMEDSLLNAYPKPNDHRG